MSVSALVKEDFSSVSVKELNKFNIDNPQYAKSAILGGVPSRLLSAILPETDIVRKLSLIRLLHDIITNDVEELADKIVADDKLQAQIVTLLSNYRDLPREFAEPLANISLKREEVAHVLLQSMEDALSPLASSDSHDKIAASFLHTLACVMNGAPFQEDLHLVLAEFFSKEKLGTEEGNEADFEFDVETPTGPLRRLNTSLLSFFTTSDQITPEFLSSPPCASFLSSIVDAACLDLLGQAKCKTFFALSEPLVSFLHHLSIVDAPEEIDMRWGLLEKEGSPLAKYLLLAVSRLTNFKTDLPTDATPAASLLAALAFFAKECPVTVLTSGIFEMLVERVLGSDSVSELDAINAASMVRVIAAVVELLGAEKADEEEEGDDEEFKKAMSLIRQMVVIRPARPVMRALGLLSKCLRPNSEGCMALCSALAAVETLCDAEEIDREALLKAKGKVVEVSTMKDCVLSVEPQNEDEEEIKSLAIILFGL